jgi:hypothetical protein
VPRAPRAAPYLSHKSENVVALLTAIADESPPTVNGWRSRRGRSEGSGRSPPERHGGAVLGAVGARPDRRGGGGVRARERRLSGRSRVTDVRLRRCAPAPGWGGRQLAALLGARVERTMSSLEDSDRAARIHRFAGPSGMLVWPRAHGASGRGRSGLSRLRGSKLEFGPAAGYWDLAASAQEGPGRLISPPFGQSAGRLARFLCDNTCRFPARDLAVRGTARGRRTRREERAVSRGTRRAGQEDEGEAGGEERGRRGVGGRCRRGRSQHRGPACGRRTCGRR